MAATWLLSAMACAQGQEATLHTPAAALGVEALPQPLSGVDMDLESIARGYADRSAVHAQRFGQQQGPGLLIFISLAMPRPSLERLFDQAERARATLVLRGFVDGSLQRTTAELQPLIGARRIAAQIDPPAFDRFGILRVPSFVLLHDGTRPQSCASGSCAPPENYLQVAGDVSLDYALEHMLRTGPTFEAQVRPFLERLGR